jgi:hypothetical protein
MRFYPHIAAPGGNILSTYPLSKGGYAVDSGTSMACPHISGVVALYLSVKGKTNPVKLRNFLASTATPIDFNNGTQFSVGLKTSVAQQGGGLVDAYRLLKATTQIEPGFIELNVTLFTFTADCVRTAHDSMEPTKSALPIKDQKPQPIILEAFMQRQLTC